MTEYGYRFKERPNVSEHLYLKHQQMHRTVVEYLTESLGSVRLHEDGVIYRYSPKDGLWETYHDSAFDGGPWGGLCKYQKLQNPKGPLIALVFQVSSQLLDYSSFSHKLFQLVAQFDGRRLPGRKDQVK